MKDTSYSTWLKSALKDMALVAKHLHALRQFCEDKMTKTDIITMIIFLPIFAAIFSACLARDIDQDVKSSTKTNSSRGIAEGGGR